jgi:hypothetical protein
LRFYDGSAVYAIPDVFNSFSSTEFKQLHIEQIERRIPFKPVVTNQRLPARLAFVGLNAYCSEDYREAVKQANFTVWCQARYNQKIFAVIEKYEILRLTADLGEGTSYFTDFVKVVLPDKQFKGTAGVVAVIKESEHLKSLFEDVLKQEIVGLAKEGCRAFICFGNEASYYFEEALNNCLKVVCRPVADRIKEFSLGEQRLFIVNDRHYAYYSKQTTDSLVSSLKKLLSD